MLRTLLLTIALVIVAAAFLPGLRVAIAWVLAFLSLLMAADLLRSLIRRHDQPEGGS